MSSFQYFCSLLQMEGGKPGAAGAATSEGVLASFFNSLLNKKTGQGMPGEPGAQIKSPGGADDCKLRSYEDLCEPTTLVKDVHQLHAIRHISNILLEY